MPWSRPHLMGTLRGQRERSELGESFNLKGGLRRGCSLRIETVGLCSAAYSDDLVSISTLGLQLPLRAWCPLVLHLSLAQATSSVPGLTSSSASEEPWECVSPSTFRSPYAAALPLGDLSLYSSSFVVILTLPTSLPAAAKSQKVVVGDSNLKKGSVAGWARILLLQG
jgi:hypothetical protein